MRNVFTQCVCEHSEHQNEIEEFVKRTLLECIKAWFAKGGRRFLSWFKRRRKNKQSKKSPGMVTRPEDVLSSSKGDQKFPEE